MRPLMKVAQNFCNRGGESTVDYYAARNVEKVSNAIVGKMTVVVRVLLL